MSGTSKSTQDTQQQSQTNPWAPTLPYLNQFLGQTGSLFGSVNPTQAQTDAFKQIATNAGNTPDYSQQALGYASNLIGGGNNYNPMVQGTFDAQTAGLNPLMTGSLDPMSTPGLSDALNAMKSDITNSVNGQFAAAGRDLSGMNSLALGKGLTQGMAPAIVQAYQNNVNNRLAASGQLGQAANAAAGTMSGLDQTRFGNQAAGFNWLTSGLPTASNAAAMNTIAAGKMPFDYTAGNLGTLGNLLLPIAGLGGQSTGTSNTQGTQTMSPFQMAMMGINTAANAAKAFNFSDRRMKRDIERIGTLYDGTPVYRFRYLTSDATNIGLMADDIEKFAPDAVTVNDYSGFKMVDYRAATERAAKKAH